jgi:hypothetical protein
MSFERFSTSDIYMYEHVGGFIECCGCWFSGDWFEREVYFPQFKTPREALAHLDTHEKAGHDIGHARVRIEKDYPDLDIQIQPYVPSPEAVKAREAFFKSLKDEVHPPKEFRDKSNGE